MPKNAAEPKWGRIPPERRGRWGRFLMWQRFLNGDQTQETVRATLLGMGEEISGPYYSDFETGKATPNTYWQGVFTRLWNAQPEPEPDPAAPTSAAPDLTDLIAAMARQSETVTALLDELRAERRERASLTETVEELKRQLRDLAATLREGGGGDDPPRAPTRADPDARRPGGTGPRSQSQAMAAR